MSDYPWDDIHHCSYFLPQQPNPFDQHVVESKYFVDKHFFSISTIDPWYGDFLTYL
jgi:hypothetical protein